MKQVFRAHRLCKQDGYLGPYIDSYEAEMRGKGYTRKRERCKSVWSPISAAGWPNEKPRCRTLPPSRFGRTFGREHGVDVQQGTIYPLYSGRWRC